MEHGATLARVESHFDRTAHEAWARLTSDAPVSGIRATVRAGRDEMRARILAALPEVAGASVLDAGCGTGALAGELAWRGAEVVAVDISPRLVALARERHGAAVDWRVGDLTDPALGSFDHVVAMDSLIFYGAADLARIVGDPRRRARSVHFTLPPRTLMLSAMWRVGRQFPRADRSPLMVPQSAARLAAAGLPAREIARVARGFYISTLWAVEGRR